MREGDGKVLPDRFMKYQTHNFEIRKKSSVNNALELAIISSGKGRGPRERGNDVRIAPKKNTFKLTRKIQGVTYHTKLASYRQ